jgi:ribosomal protein S18 acetylase RimI-like enzyme
MQDRVATTTFRLAGAGDVPALRQLVERAYRGDSARFGWTHEADLLDDERTSNADLAATIAEPTSRIILAEAAGALTGTVTITDLGGARAYLGMLCVDPALQAAGFGRALIAQAEAVAREAFGARVMEMTVIDVRHELIAWYLRCGYRNTGETRPFPVPGNHRFAMAVLERAFG